MDRKKFIRNGILGIASLATAAKLLESCSKDDNNTNDNASGDGTCFPGWYPGRAPHVHVEVLTASGSSLLVTQIAFPENVSSAVYSSTSYASHGQADTSNTKDNVFSDSLANELATLTGNLTDGYTLSKTITVNG
jgi:protocatechuate 3,4-dioxygenase beta subunit